LRVKGENKVDFHQNPLSEVVTSLSEATTPFRKNPHPFLQPRHFGKPLYAIFYSCTSGAGDIRTPVPDGSPKAYDADTLRQLANFPKVNAADGVLPSIAIQSNCIRQDSWRRKGEFFFEGKGEVGLFVGCGNAMSECMVQRCSIEYLLLPAAIKKDRIRWFPGEWGEVTFRIAKGMSVLESIFSASDRTYGNTQ
jgi:hypothetical protein